MSKETRPFTGRVGGEGENRERPAEENKCGGNMMPGLLGALAANPFSEMNKNEMEKFWAEQHQKIIFNMLANGQFTDLSDDRILVKMLSVSNVILQDMKEQSKPSGIQMNDNELIEYVKKNITRFSDITLTTVAGAIDIERQRRKLVGGDVVETKEETNG